MAFENYRRSIPDVLGDVFRNAALLVRKEGELARAELGEKLEEGAIGISLIAGAVVLMIPALIFLLGSAVYALVEAGWAASSAALLIGVAAMVVGLLLFLFGWQRLRAQELLPKRTIRQFQQMSSVGRPTTGAAE
jgi:hypothetical protein